MYHLETFINQPIHAFGESSSFLKSLNPASSYSTSLPKDFKGIQDTSDTKNLAPVSKKIYETHITSGLNGQPKSLITVKKLYE